MKCLVVGDAILPTKHYLLIQHIVRVKEINAKQCSIHMTDGSKYSFNQPAIDVIHIVTGEVSDEFQAFLEAPLGTETAQ